MPRGKRLSDAEKSKINQLRAQGLSWREIGRNIDRTFNVCQSYYRNQENYGKINRSGRKPSLSSREINHIWRLASNSVTSSSRIREELKLEVTSRTVRNKINQNPSLVYRKMLTKPVLSEKHRKSRLSWCMEKIKLGETWLKVIFSDEKRFNLDGPDGNAYYWHDIRKEKLIFSRRQAGGGSVMVWGAFSSEGKLGIQFCTGRMNSKQYTNILEDKLLSYWLSPDKNSMLFQHDNAAVHTSAETRNWLYDNAIDVID